VFFIEVFIRLSKFISPAYKRNLIALVRLILLTPVSISLILMLHTIFGEIISFGYFYNLFTS
jgi:hypothetical protein